MLPNFLGLGAPKSATTWLFHCLREHPEVFMAENKELMFFDYGSIDGRLPSYEQHFEGTGDAKAIGEFSTRYLASTRAPERVRALIPEAKLVVSLRCPADQIYSHYWHLRRQNFHASEPGSSALTFDDALEKIPGLLLEPAYYSRHLNRWLASFDRSRVHVIIYDDIAEDPAAVLRALYRFLDVDEQFIPEFMSRNDVAVRRGTAPRSDKLESIYRRLYTVLARRIFLPLKAVIGVRRADRLKSILRAREVMTWLFHDTGYPTMREATRRMLEQKYEPDVHELSRLLGRSLRHWSGKPGTTETG